MATLAQFQHIIKIGLSGVTAKALTGTITATGNAEDGRSVDVPAGTTNQAVTFNFKVATMQSLYLLTNGDLTIKANNSGTPDYTLTAKNGTPIWWVTGQGMTNPITTDTTTWYLTNAGTATVRLDVSVLQNS